MPIHYPSLSPHPLFILFVFLIYFQLLDMACLRLKLVFPKEYPNQVSFRYYGTRVRITKRNLKDVLWTVSQYKNIMSGDEASVGDGKD